MVNSYLAYGVVRRRVSFALALALAAYSVVGVAGAALAAPLSSTIDFESGLGSGSIPSTLAVGSGISGASLGTVAVTGTNPNLAGNSAMIFDSSCGGQTVPVTDPSWDPTACSGDDADLYIPGQGNTLIITEDGSSAVPDDLAGPGGFLTFDFSNWGPGTVTWNRISVIDLETAGAEIRLFDAGGTAITTIPMGPTGGDNTIATTVGDVAGVGSMVVYLGESGSIDDLRITAEIPIIDLELTKTVDQASVTVGEAVTFTINVTNQGPDDATGVQVTDTLPAGLTYVSDSGAGAYDSPSGVWTIGNLAVGASVTLDLTVTVDEAGTFVNEAEGTAANEQDSDSVPADGTGDDWDDQPIEANEPPPPPPPPPAIIDLELTKTVDQASVTVGEAVTFTINVTNQGPDDATGVQVTDTLPAGLTYVSDSGAGAYDSPSGVWTIGNLAVGASVTLDLTVTVDEAGTFVNEAEVTAANEQDSDSVPADGTGDDWDDQPIEAAQVLASGLIGDTVWSDDDKDAIEDAGENGVAGVTITLTNDDTSVVATTVTNADGKYLFSALDPGNYTVKINKGTTPEMTVLTTVGSFSIPLGVDEQFLTADFGIAAGLPTTGLEIGQFAFAGSLLLAAGLVMLLATRRKKLLVR